MEEIVEAPYEKVDLLIKVVLVMLTSSTSMKIKKKLKLIGGPSSIIIPKKDVHYDTGPPVISIMQIHSPR